jgi:hypothetical protein
MYSQGSARSASISLRLSAICNMIILDDQIRRVLSSYCTHLILNLPIKNKLKRVGIYNQMLKINAKLELAVWYRSESNIFNSVCSPATAVAERPYMPLFKLMCIIDGSSVEIHTILSIKNRRTARSVSMIQ